jgi:hypothetical protein
MLLVSIFETFASVLDHRLAGSEDVRGYMIALGKIPRFSTIILLMNTRERDLMNSIWDRLGLKTTNRPYA